MLRAKKHSTLRAEVNEFRLWKAIYQQIPEAEIQRLDGTRKKLSDIFGHAHDVKSTPEISRQSKDSCQQLSLEFGNNCDHQERGAT
jgi:hypothetical protein